MHPQSNVFAGSDRTNGFDLNDILGFFDKFYLHFVKYIECLLPVMFEAFEAGCWVTFFWRR
jgi:hypothetical protein